MTKRVYRRNPTNRKPSKEILQRVADNVRRLRAERYLTQKQLAKAMRKTKTFVSSVENTRVNNLQLSSLEAFSDAFGCDAHEIVAHHYENK